MKYLIIHPWNQKLSLFILFNRPELTMNSCKCVWSRYSCAQFRKERPLLFLLLFESHGLQSEGAGNEADVCPLFHQPSNPPVIIVLLQHKHEGKHAQRYYGIMGTVSKEDWPAKPFTHLTSLMCRKSLASKFMAVPWTGQSSSRAPQ